MQNTKVKKQIVANKTNNPQYSSTLQTTLNKLANKLDVTNEQFGKMANIIYTYEFRHLTYNERVTYSIVFNTNDKVLIKKTYSKLGRETYDLNLFWFTGNTAHLLNEQVRLSKTQVKLYTHLFKEDIKLHHQLMKALDFFTISDKTFKVVDNTLFLKSNEVHLNVHLASNVCTVTKVQQFKTNLVLNNDDIELTTFEHYKLINKI